MDALLGCPPVPTTGLGLLDSWVEGWTAAGEGVADCTARLIASGPFGLDIPRWLGLTATRRAP